MSSVSAEAHGRASDGRYSYEYLWTAHLARPGTTPEFFGAAKGTTPSLFDSAATELVYSGVFDSR